MEYRKYNEYQTPVEELEELSKEAREELLSALDDIEFIKRLISPEMKTVAEMPKDEAGKVIVDITNPHRLENMDYFRQAAIHFQEHGVYTSITPSSHPLSQYKKFWDQEIDKIRNGVVREDGEWIPGGLYWYWNYCPMERTKRRKQSSKRSDRVVDFPDVFLGDYLFFHYLEQAMEAGSHGELLKTRGVGWSYKQASFGPRKALFFKNSSTFYAAYEKEFLVKDGVLNKAWAYLDFLAQHTPFPRMRLRDSIMEKKMGYKDPKDNAEKGMLSNIMGVSAKDDPDKLRGKRGDIYFEEHGVFPQIKKAWQVSLDSVEDGENVFGLMVAGGTGGTLGADFEGAEDMHYNPESYHIYGIPNVFDRFAVGKTNTGFFWGAYLNRANCYDSNGMPDVVKALKEIMVDRDIVKKSSTDPVHVTQRKAERPITPQEAVMRVEGNFFPVADLKDYLERCRIEGVGFTNRNYVGNLVFDKEIVKWEESLDLIPVRNYPLKDNKVEGAIEIYTHPKKMGNKPVPNRYIGGIDPIDDDASTTSSLASIFIFDLFADEIVAEYTGRPKFAKDFYEICRRLLLYYDARANYESDKKGIFAHFELYKCLYLLVDTPQILRDMEYVKTSGYGNKAHPYSEKIYTPTGIKRWGDMNIGDVLYGTNKSIIKITDIPFDNVTTIYELTLKDGRKVKASANHLWKVIDWNNIEKILSTEELLTGYYRTKGKYKEYKYYIPKNEGVDFIENKLPLDSYTLGLLLGDGCMTNSRHHNADFSSSLEDIDSYKCLIPFEIKTKDDRHHSIRIENIGNILKSLGLSETKSRTKFIPDIYKYSSRNSRLNIIKGLFDTDGNIGYGGNPEFVSTSKKLAEDVMEVLRSLGINCNLNIIINNFGEVFKVRAYSHIKLFKLERKISRQRITKTRAFKTAIINIEEIGVEKAKCVTVSSEDNCYLIGDFITTHNSKGTNSGKTINAWGRRLQRDWLLTPAINKNIDNEGNIIESTLNMHKIRSLAYLEELINWNADGNFDRVSSMGMCMILRADKMKYIESYKNIDTTNGSELAQDPYFRANYDDKWREIIDFSHSEGRP